VLELGGGEAAVSQCACGVDLLTKNGARRDADEIVGLLASHVASTSAVLSSQLARRSVPRSGTR